MVVAEKEKKMYSKEEIIQLFWIFLNELEKKWDDIVLYETTYKDLPKEVQKEYDEIKGKDIDELDLVNI